MQNVLAVDVAKGKSMVSLISSCGEVLIEPYEINHSIIDFSNLLNRINKLKLDNISVIMESTGIYHRPIERFFLENNFKVFVINALYSKISEELIGKNPQELSEYSQSQNELFNLLAQMLETKELTANEQEILKDGLKIIDISKLTNSKTVETINSFMAK